MNLAQGHMSRFAENSTRLPALLIIASFALVPVYIFGSGRPQPVDLPLLCLVIYVVLTLNYFEVKWLSTIFLAFAAFLCWAISINVYHFVMLTESGFLKSSLHLAYNMTLFFVCIVVFFRLLADTQSEPYLYTATLVGTITPFVATGIPTLKFTTRHTLSFNDPNQLADFALLMMATIFVLNHYYRHKGHRLHKVVVGAISFTVFLLGHVYILLSASRAGMGGLIVVDGIMLWQMRNKLLMMLMPLISLAIIVAALQLNSSTPGNNPWQFDNLLIGSRMNVDLPTTLEKRTASRLDLGDMSFIVGIGKCAKCPGKKAGENTFHLQREAHNTLVDIAYSYGIIGLCLYALFLVQYFKVAFRTLFFIPVFMAFIPVNISQNFIRFRSAWIFYALVYAVSTWHMVQRDTMVQSDTPEEAIPASRTSC